MFTRLPSSALRLTGADRLDFAQGQMTNDLKGAPTPGMVPACFLNARGQIEFFARVYKRADDLYLHLAAGEAPALAARLKKYIIFDQVEVQDLSDTLATVHVWGEEVPGWDASGAAVQTFTLAGTEVLAARVNRSGRVGLDLHYLQAKEADVLAELGQERPLADLSHARIQTGLPDVSADHWQGYLLQEVGLGDAISYRKGCYVGQEIMARLEARGQTRYTLMALAGEGLPAHAEVTSTGKVVGVTGESAGTRALVRLRRELEPGAQVEVGGVAATVEPAQPTLSDGSHAAPTA